MQPHASFPIGQIVVNTAILLNSSFVACHISNDEPSFTFAISIGQECILSVHAGYNVGILQQLPNNDYIFFVIYDCIQA